MPNLMQRGAAWLGQQAKTAAGRTVTYCRGSEEFTVTGWPQFQDREVIDDDGIPLQRKIFTWGFVASDMGFDGDPEPFKSRPGDQIRETLSGTVITYEAMPLDAKRPVDEDSDTAGILLAVHTKIVKRCQAS